MHTSRTTTLTLGAATAALTLLLTGCSSDGHNDADVAFAQDMLVHHAQALTMVDLADDRPLDPAVEQLAAQIEQAQGPEIETFTGWLQEWDEEVPDTSGDMGGMEDTEDMGDMDHDMPGMMSEQDMAELEGATDQEFQRRWLEMMIEHHEGAIVMADAHVEAGEHEPAIELAEEISTTQESEISTMEDLLAR